MMLDCLSFRWLHSSSNCELLCGVSPVELACSVGLACLVGGAVCCVCALAAYPLRKIGFGRMVVLYFSGYLVMIGGVTVLRYYVGSIPH
jgi:hypothetical protein